MARRIHHNDLAGKNYDHVLITMGAVEHDARSLNVVRTLQNEYSDLLLIGLFTPKWQVSCKDIDADVLLMDDYKYTPMYKLWTGFYRWLNTFRYRLKGGSFWAMDLYGLPFAVRMGRRTGGRSLYDSREVYSALGEAAGHPVKQKIISFVERRYIRRVNKVFTSGELDSGHLAEIYHIPMPPVVMNLPRYRPPESSVRLREAFDIASDKKIMIYQGVLHPGRGLLHAVKILPAVPELVLCMLGTGESFSRQLSDAALQSGVTDRVYFHPPVPYSELHEWTSSADVGLCFIEPLSLSLKYALPNKLFEYAMAGVPSVVSDLPQMTPYIEKYGCGVSLPADSGEQPFARAVAELLKPEVYSRMKRNALAMGREVNWERQQNIIYHLAEHKNDR